MTSRERIRAALNHKQPDRVPVDFGSLPVSGIAIGTVYRLRQALGLESPVPAFCFRQGDRSGQSSRPGSRNDVGSAHVRASHISQP